MQTAPHVERLARLLHNRIVRRVRHAHPDAAVLVVVGDLTAGEPGPGYRTDVAAVLRPVALWGAEGAALAGAAARTAPEDAWQTLLDDLRADFLLLARVSPVELFVPYLLDLREIDLRLEVDDRSEERGSY